MLQHDLLRIYPFSNTGDNPIDCDCCVSKSIAGYVVERSSFKRRNRFYFCCDRCAQGWQEIKDRHSSTVEGNIDIA